MLGGICGSLRVGETKQLGMGLSCLLSLYKRNLKEYTGCHILCNYIQITGPPPPPPAPAVHPLPPISPSITSTFNPSLSSSQMERKCEQRSIRPSFQPSWHGLLIKSWFCLGPPLPQLLFAARCKRSHAKILLPV